MIIHILKVNINSSSAICNVMTILVLHTLIPYQPKATGILPNTTAFQVRHYVSIITLSLVNNKRIMLSIRHRLIMAN